MIGRRGFLQGSAALLAAPGVLEATRALAAEPGERRFRVTLAVDLEAAGPGAVLYVPVFERRSEGQSATAARISCSGEARLVREPRTGAQVVRARFNPGAPRRLEVVQTVSTRPRALSPARLGSAERALWTAPTPSAPTDGLVRETALRIVAGRRAPREKARAVYDWVVDNTFRDASVRGCGLGGVENMLRSGRLGGKCADINGLYVALCRAVGLPARDLYGLRLGRSQTLACLGTAGPDVTHAQHCRAEVFLEGEGWLPVDPADVRKAVLEDKAMDGAAVAALRERLFGRFEMNWAAYNSATDPSLPGAPRTPAEHFLMYPMALAPGGEADQLDPDAFRYRILSEEI